MILCVIDEAQRFLRYILPGVVFLIEVLIALLILEPCLIYKLKKLVTVGGTLTLLVTSGGLGALLSMVYFWIFRNISDFKCFWSWIIYPNYVPLLQDAVNQNKLKIIFRENGDYVPRDSLKPETARRIVTSLWAELKDGSTIGESVVGRARSLYDILHGFGATLVGSVIAFLLPGIYYSCLSSDCALNIPYIIVAVFFIVVHLCTYWTVARHTNGVICMLFYKALERDKKRQGEIPKIYISCNNLGIIACLRRWWKGMRNKSTPLDSCLRRNDEYMGNVFLSVWISPLGRSICEEDIIAVARIYLLTNSGSSPE